MAFNRRPTRLVQLRVGVAALAACAAALAVMRMLIGDRLTFALPPLEVEGIPGVGPVVSRGALLHGRGVILSRPRQDDARWGS